MHIRSSGALFRRRGGLSFRGRGLFRLGLRLRRGRGQPRQPADRAEVHGLEGGGRGSKGWARLLLYVHPFVRDLAHREHLFSLVIADPQADRHRIGPRRHLTDFRVVDLHFE